MKSLVTKAVRTGLVAVGTLSPPTAADFAGRSFYMNTSTRQLFGLNGSTVTRIKGTSTSTPPPPAASSRIVPQAYTLHPIDAEYQRLWGPGVNRTDGLYNSDLVRRGGLDYACIYRFMATENSALQSITYYQSAGDGYAAGNGGSLLHRVFPCNADGSLNLSGQVMGYMTYNPSSNGMTNGVYPRGNRGTDQGFFEIPVGMVIPLVRGNRYGILFENVASDPVNNWSSVDNNRTDVSNGRGNRWLDPLDWGVMVGNRAAGSTGAYNWSDRTINTYTNSTDNAPTYQSPILQIKYSNGQIFGATPMETGNRDVGTSGTPIYRCVSGDIYRALLTPDAAMQVGGLTWHIGCETAGTLRLVIYNAQGQTIFSMTKTFTSDVVWKTPGGQSSRFMTTQVKEFDFGSNITIPTGQCAFDLEVQSGQFVSGVNRHGANYGFQWPAAFTKSAARIKQGGAGFKYTNLWDHTQDGTAGIEVWPIVLHKV